MGEQTSSGKLSIVLFALLTAAASYFVIGIQNQFGLLMLGMVGLTFLLGVAGKIKPGVAKFTLLALLFLGVGSHFIQQQGYSTYAFGARAIALIIFIFTAISAIGTILKVLLGFGGVVLIVVAIGYVMQSKELKQADNEDNSLVYKDEHPKTDSISKDQEIKFEEKPDEKNQT